MPLKWTTFRLQQTGYREYKPSRYEPDENNLCTVINRHVWQDAIEQCEHIRHSDGMRQLYKQRKENIERIFGTAKEHHGMRYTHLVGRELMEFKVGLTYTCLNMKNLVKLLSQRR